MTTTTIPTLDLADKAAQAVRDAAAHLADASDAAHDLAHVLASAQQCLAHLGATKPTTPPTKGVSFQPLKGGQFSSAVDICIGSAQ